MLDLERIIEGRRPRSHMGSTGGRFGPKVSGDQKAVAEAQAALDDLPLVLCAARDNAQAGLRVLRHVERQVSAARRARRIEAERKASPKPTKPTMPAIDGWQNVYARKYGSGS